MYAPSKMRTPGEMAPLRGLILLWRGLLVPCCAGQATCRYSGTLYPLRQTQEKQKWFPNDTPPFVAGIVGGSAAIIPKFDTDGKTDKNFMLFMEFFQIAGTFFVFLRLYSKEKFSCWSKAVLKPFLNQSLRICNHFVVVSLHSWGI